MSSAPKIPRACLTPEEILQALRALPGLDWIRLERAAALISLKLAGSTGAELLNEAIVRSLDVDRNFPSDVALIPFLVRTMQSIVSSERKRARKHTGLDCLTSLADAAPTVVEIMEQEEAERLLRTRVRRALGHLPNACSIALGILDGLRGDSLRIHTGLDKIAYGSARRALKRFMFLQMKRFQ